MTGVRKHEEKWYRLFPSLGRGWGQKSRFLSICLLWPVFLGHNGAQKPLNSVLHTPIPSAFHGGRSRTAQQGTTMAEGPGGVRQLADPAV